MGVLSAPWADLVLFFRHFTDSVPGEDTRFSLWIYGLVLFVSVSLILLQLILYFNWKLKQVDRELSVAQEKCAIFRRSSTSAVSRKIS